MAVGRRTRILIVDDSAVMRSLLRSVVSADPKLEVSGSAADGVLALASLGEPGRDSRLEPLPDLILLDVEMPVMDGLTTLRELRRRGHRMPVIMCSALTQRGAAVTLEALAGGASDYVAKPAGQLGREAAMAALGAELLPKIHGLTEGNRRLNSEQTSAVTFGPTSVGEEVGARPEVLVIGVSTGGPAALEILLPALPVDLPLPVLIVQHMPEVFTKQLAERLNERCKLTVREAVENDAVRAGTIAIARGNWHLEVASGLGATPTLHLTQGPLENHCRPAVDVLFRSVARVYGGAVLAVVLTGMGSDGLLGSRAIRERGGRVLAQDRATSAVWGMPGAVVNAGLAHKVSPIATMAAEIIRLTGQTVRSQPGPRALRERVG